MCDFRKESHISFSLRRLDLISYLLHCSSIFSYKIWRKRQLYIKSALNKLWHFLFNLYFTESRTFLYIKICLFWKFTKLPVKIHKSKKFVVIFLIRTSYMSWSKRFVSLHTCWVFPFSITFTRFLLNKSLLSFTTFLFKKKHGLFEFKPS